MTAPVFISSLIFGFSVWLMDTNWRHPLVWKVFYQDKECKEKPTLCVYHKIVSATKLRACLIKKMGVIWLDFKHQVYPGTKLPQKRALTFKLLSLFESI